LNETISFFFSDDLEESAVQQDDSAIPSEEEKQVEVRILVLVDRMMYRTFTIALDLDHFHRRKMKNTIPKIRVKRRKGRSEKRKATLEGRNGRRREED